MLGQIVNWNHYFIKFVLKNVQPFIDNPFFVCFIHYNLLFIRYISDLIFKTKSAPGIFSKFFMKLFWGTLKFKLFIKESKQLEIIDFFRWETPDEESTRASKLRKNLNASCSLFSNFENLPFKYFHINGIEKLDDPAPFFNRKLTNLAPSFMKKIQQDLIEICIYLNISFHGKKSSTAVPNRVFKEYRHQGSNYFISQSCDLATIKCSNRNIFVNIDVLKRSEYFRFYLQSKVLTQPKFSWNLTLC